MNEKIKAYLEKYPSKIIEIFYEIRQMILDSAPELVEEKNDG